MPIGNSVRIARDRPAQSPLLLYHSPHDLSIGKINKICAIFLVKPHKMQEKPPFLAVFGHFFGFRWQVMVKL